MTCDDVIELLAEYTDGTIDAVQRADVDAHLATCVACSELLAQYRALPELLRSQLHDEMPPEARAALWRKLAQRKPP